MNCGSKGKEVHTHASAEEYSQSGLRARTLVLGMTAGLSYSSDPCLLTLTYSAVFSLNDTYCRVLASWCKGSYQHEFGEDREGEGGRRRQWGRMKKGECDVGSHSGISKVSRLP